MTPESLPERLARYEARMAELEKANLTLSQQLTYTRVASDLFEQNSKACAAEYEAKMQLQKRESQLVKLLIDCFQELSCRGEAPALVDEIHKALELNPTIKRGSLVHHRNNPSHAMALDGVNLNTFQAVCSWKKGDLIKQEWFDFHELEPHTSSPTDHNAPKS